MVAENPTSFPNGPILVDGVPTQGMSGIPLTNGRVYFVDAVNGADGNSGTSANPLQSISALYAKLRDGYGDGGVLIPRATTAASTTGTFRLSDQIAWAKSCTFLVGAMGPGLNQRARISTATDATANIANLFNVTAQNAIFSNFSLFQGVGQTSTAECLWQDAGQRNFYGNVFFGGMGSANGAAQAGSYTLKLAGGSENRFAGCYFGTDTQSRDAANANVVFAAGAAAATRNVFEDCMFAAFCTDTDPTFVSAGASTLDRFQLFSRCKFINTGSSSMAAAVTGNASQGGKIILDDCRYYGVTEIGSLSNSALILVTGAVPNGNTSGVGVNANPS